MSPKRMKVTYPTPKIFLKKLRQAPSREERFKGMMLPGPFGGGEVYVQSLHRDYFTAKVYTF